MTHGVMGSQTPARRATKQMGYDTIGDKGVHNNEVLYLDNPVHALVVAEGSRSHCNATYLLSQLPREIL